MDPSKENDLRWLGGYLSHGGHLGLIKRQDCTYVMLRFQSTSKSLIEEIIRIIPVHGSFMGPLPLTKRAMGVPAGRRAAWAVIYNGHHIGEYLSTLLPYMRGRQADKLREILEEWSGRRDRPHASEGAGGA